jgi:hypothetical protein
MEFFKNLACVNLFTEIVSKTTSSSPVEACLTLGQSSDCCICILSGTKLECETTAWSSKSTCTEKEALSRACSL